MPIETIVFSEELDPRPWLVARTLKSLRRMQHEARVISREALPSALVRARGPVWLVRAGACFEAFPRFVASATGKPLLALAAADTEPAWKALLASTGGDLARAKPRALPEPHSVLLERPSSLAAALDRGASIHTASSEVAGASRALASAGLGLTYTRALRVLVAVTTLHRGGAERIAAELARGLVRHEIEAHFAVLDAPRRETVTSPPIATRLYANARDRGERLEALVKLVEDEGIDLVSAHLLDVHELDALASRGVRTVVTLHNTRAGWPEGTERSRATAFVACSRRAAHEAVEAGVGAPVRVAFNGVHVEQGVADPETRASLGIDARALLLIAVANARPQKRLEKAVSVLASLVRRGTDAHLVIVGAPLAGNVAAQASSRLVDEVAEARGVTARVHRVGSSADVSRWLGCADVMLSTSAWEGMSLAQLEALDAGVPVVAADVGGADEIARAHPGRYVRVATDASDDAYADAVRSVAGKRRDRGEGLARPFTTEGMLARYAYLFGRVARSRRGGPAWLVTNNLATGGAQSSARRLLLGLRARGVDVRAAVLQEQQEHPTEGRRALESAGVNVLAAPCADEHDPAETVAEIVRAIDREGARAVLLWNVIPEHKVLLADALIGTRVIDVSPGEMYYASLDRYFRSPRAGSPILDGRDYGALLAGMVVKYAAEAERAARALGVSARVIPNGVELRDRKRARTSHERLVVGTLARLSPDKKLEQLVAATRVAVACGAPPFELRIAGAVETSCEAWARDLEASCEGLPVRFVGERSSAEFLDELDVFAMISEPLGCPNSSLEAMAAGLPVVATDAGGARDQLEDGAGVLVPRGDVDALGRALARVLADSALRSELGARAEQRVRERFSLERMVDDYVAILGE